MKKRSLVTLLAMLIALTLMLVACGGSDEGGTTQAGNQPAASQPAGNQPATTQPAGNEPAAEPIHLSWWKLNEHVDGLNEVIASFTSRHPHVTIEWAGHSNETLHQNLEISAISNTLPSMWFQWGGALGGRYVQYGVTMNVVMKSEMPLWQIPINVYKQMSVSLAELQVRVKPYGKIGKYLFEQMVEFNMKTAHITHWPHGEIWGLGDSPTISVLLEETEKLDIFDEVHAPNINYDDLKYEHNTVNRKIRVYNFVNPRLTMEDFYAKMMINFPSV